MISVIAHAGDGNTHPLIVYDAADAAMTERAHLAFGEIMDLAIGLGGTITGEHGVGRLKRPWLDGYLGPEVMDAESAHQAGTRPVGHPEPRRSDLACVGVCSSVELGARSAADVELAARSALRWLTYCGCCRTNKT